MATPGYWVSSQFAHLQMDGAIYAQARVEDSVKLLREQ